MCVLTLVLVGLLVAAWKAPKWTKEIGLIALVTGFIGPMFSFAQAAKAVMAAGDISTSLLWGGYRAALIPIIYGMLIYLLSLIFRLIRKPRY